MTTVDGFSSQVSLATGTTTACLGKNAAAADNMSGMYWDDLVVSQIAPPGNMDVFFKASSSSTPTYDAFTKSNGSTIDTLWWLAPGGGTGGGNAYSTASGAAQTMVPAAFTLGSTGEVAGCKIELGAFRGAGAACAVYARHRVGGVNTDDVVTLTTSRNVYFSSIFRPSPSQLSTMEAGVVRAACTSQTTTVDALGVLCATPK
jgi:hypothetical protein